MAKWIKAAEGSSPDKLAALVGDKKLNKGDKVQWVLDFKVPFVARTMDMAGAEQMFKPFVPDGLILKDVYEKGGKGYVDMEADPAWLLAVVAFVKAHWLAILIAGFAIAAIVKWITMWIQLAETAFGWIIIVLVVVAVVAIGYAIYRLRGPPR